MTIVAAFGYIVIKSVMSNLRENIKRIWLECFDDSPEYVDMYFDRVYREEDALTMDDASGKPLSSLLLQQYVMLCYGREVSVGYVAGAATRRQARGNGLMSALLSNALAAARNRGDMAVALIPATRSLYFFYDRLGFATVFYRNVERYTASHAFQGIGSWHEVSDPYSNDVWEAFSVMERSLPGMPVLHDKRDFVNILDDLGMDEGGRFCAIADDNGTVAAMAWCVADSRQVYVKAMLSRDMESRSAVLRQLRQYYPDLPFVVETTAGSGVEPRPVARGMLRLVNVPMALQLMAAAHPGLKLTMRVRDSQIADNCGVFVIDAGKTSRTDRCPARLDFDVDVTVLTELLFGSPASAEITGLPACRPYMALMLD